MEILNVPLTLGDGDNSQSPQGDLSITQCGWIGGDAIVLSFT